MTPEPIGPIVAQSFAIIALVVFAVLCGERDTFGGIVYGALQIAMSVFAILYWSA